MGDLDEDVEGMQSMIYVLQQQLKEAKDQVVQLQEENERLQASRSLCDNHNTDSSRVVSSHSLDNFRGQSHQRTDMSKHDTSNDNFNSVDKNSIDNDDENGDEEEMPMETDNQQHNQRKHHSSSHSDTEQSHSVRHSLDSSIDNSDTTRDSRLYAGDSEMMDDSSQDDSGLNGQISDSTLTSKKEKVPASQDKDSSDILLNGVTRTKTLTVEADAD